MEKEAKEIKSKHEEMMKKYNVTMEKLDELDMDVFDYANLIKRSIKNYIKGLIFNILDNGNDVDIRHVVENIINQSMVVDDDADLLVIITGEICGFVIDSSSDVNFVARKICDFVRLKKDLLCD